MRSRFGCGPVGLTKEARTKLWPKNLLCDAGVVKAVCFDLSESELGL